MLAGYFGTTETDKGNALLSPRVRVVQGDGISVDKLAGICNAVIDAKFALGNLTFGSGGGLLQSATRDTLKFVYKTSAGLTVDKAVQMMSKDLITDQGKKSKEGLLTVEWDDGVFTTVVAETGARPTRTTWPSRSSRPTTRTGSSSRSTRCKICARASTHATPASGSATSREMTRTL